MPILVLILNITLLFGCKEDNTFKDPRDGKTYRTVKIGEQVWMAENLGFEAEGSKCYNNKPENCEKYGRLYDWATAMALPSSCNDSECAGKINAKHKGVCPSGWHIPSNDEWDVLHKFIDNNYDDYESASRTAGKDLKTTDGWKGSNGNGTDKYGFSALPSGNGYSDGDFIRVGYDADWWIPKESDASHAYCRYMTYKDDDANWNEYSKERYLFSVRCVRD